MRKLIKQYILEEHANACSEWKAKIEEKYPDLFKSEIEVGKWYKRGYELAVWNDGKPTYGFDSNGRWRGIDCMYFSSGILTPATDKEVKDALMAEAKKRGFKEGVSQKIKADFIKGEAGTTRLPFSFLVEENILLKGNYPVFQIGKWATIIEEEETKIDIERLKIVAELAEIKEKLNQIESKL